MATSIPVTAGQQATAAQYNNLRTDVLDPVIGHQHDGTGGVLMGLNWWPYGDGSDGDATISADVGMARDYFYNNLTINAGVTLLTNGHRLFVKGTMTLNGTIRHHGTDFPWATLATAFASGTDVGTYNVTSTADLATGRGGFPAGPRPGFVQIDSEIMFCTSISATTIQVQAGGRARRSTTGAAHSTSARVQFLLHGVSAVDAIPLAGVACIPGTPGDQGAWLASPPFSGGSQGTLAGGAAGTSGVAGTGGTSGTDSSGTPVQYMIPLASVTAGSGGVGGTGDAGAPAGGAAGAGGKSSPSAAIGDSSYWGRGRMPARLGDPWVALFGGANALIQGGTQRFSQPSAPSGGGGGGGGADTGPAGTGGMSGCGGISGGLITIFARILTGSGAIRAEGSAGGDGGNGSNGVGSPSGGGGGGGGGAGGFGGIILLFYNRKSSWTATLSVTAGAGGAGSTGGSPGGGGQAGASGAAGPAGTAGVTLEVVL